MRRTQKPDQVAIAQGRRAFFHVFAAETIAIFRELRGTPQLRLGDLDDLPDHVLRTMAPMFFDHAALRIQHGRLVRQAAAGAPTENVLPLDEQSAYMAGLFDGRLPLAEVARLAQARFGIDERVSYERARSLL